MIKIHAKEIIFSVFYGLFGGFVLTFLFKWMEWLTGEKVYTFLLNVDYMPIIGDIAFPEWIEVSFHLIVSVAVALGFYLMFQLRPLWKRYAIVICTMVSIIIGLFLFPTTALSNRTPEITNSIALLYWLFGHGIFGLVLGTFFKIEQQVTK